MNNFELDKAAKLKRILGLRIINALGMVAWRADNYGGAEQKIRMLHPLSWVWMTILILIATISHGVINVAKEIKQLPEDMVWW